jgi:hypothetical protein
MADEDVHATFGRHICLELLRIAIRLLSFTFKFECERMATGEGMEGHACFAPKAHTHAGSVDGHMNS